MQFLIIFASPWVMNLNLDGIYHLMRVPIIPVQRWVETWWPRTGWLAYVSVSPDILSQVQQWPMINGLSIRLFKRTISWAITWFHVVLAMGSIEWETEAKIYGTSCNCSQLLWDWSTHCEAFGSKFPTERSKLTYVSVSYSISCQAKQLAIFSMFLDQSWIYLDNLVNLDKLDPHFAFSLHRLDKVSGVEPQCGDPNPKRQDKPMFQIAMTFGSSQAVVNRLSRSKWEMIWNRNGWKEV